MIRKNIIKNKNDKQRYFLNDSWRIEMPAVVRTPFYGNNCSEYFGYVVTYSEMEQAYHLLKVDLHNGKILWSIDAVNGGYGTPTVFGDLVVFLKEFDAVQAVSAESGIVEWAVQGWSQSTNYIKCYRRNIVVWFRQHPFSRKQKRRSCQKITYSQFVYLR